MHTVADRYLAYETFGNTASYIFMTITYVSTKHREGSRNTRSMLISPTVFHDDSKVVSFRILSRRQQEGKGAQFVVPFTDPAYFTAFFPLDLVSDTQ